MIKKLTTPRLRLVFMQKLAEHKCKAIGEWPEDFKLALDGDQAITELAKLEERWLGLDR